jgi:nicotinate-nucleotide pyrophosphorylase (carboxylating)
MKKSEKWLSLPARIEASLREDGAFHDITTAALPGVRSERCSAVLIAHRPGVLSGVNVIAPVFKRLDPRARVSILKKDGSRLKASDRVARIHASAAAVLAGERLMLNLITHLSGVATLTRRFVDAIQPHQVAIVDTRKTTPLWRDLERDAVKHGGGENNRFNLSDAILVKDNHLAYLAKRKIRAHAVYGADAPARQRRPAPAFVAIEAKNNAEVWEAIKARPDIILLDNMALDQLKGSILFIKAARRGLQIPTPYIEVTGGVTLEKAAQLAALGVDRISIGALTHSAPSLDMSLEVF